MLSDILFWGVPASVILSGLFRKPAARRTLKNLPWLQNTPIWMPLGNGIQEKVEYTYLLAGVSAAVFVSWMAISSLV